MIQTQKVLHYIGTDDEYVLFSRIPDDETDVPPRLYLIVDDWEAMGEPNVATVSVEPGDLLNPDQTNYTNDPSAT